MTVSGSTATATLSHFSPAWLVLVSQHLIDPVVTFLSTALKQRYPRPACVGNAATVAGQRYVAVASGNGVYPCLSNQQGALNLEVTSNSPFVWRLKPSAGAGNKLGA